MPTKAPIHQPEHVRLRPKTAQPERDYEQHRGTAHQRGYGKRWQKVRRLKLGRDPLCIDCARAGHTTPATEVHHIQSRKEFPALAYELSNLESLCKACHNRKRRG